MTFPTELKVVGTFHVPFTEFLYELGGRGRHTECACYFCRKRFNGVARTGSVLADAAGWCG